MPPEEIVTAELWVLVDERGNYVCHVEQQKLTDQYEKDVGGLDAGTASRLLRITVTLPKPRPVQLAGEVAAEHSVAELRIA